MDGFRRIAWRNCHGPHLALESFLRTCRVSGRRFLLIRRRRVGTFFSLSASVEGSRVNIAYTKWVTGLGGARLERCRGRTPLQDLDDKALLAAVRVLEDAHKYQGLFWRAVKQLALNWENTFQSLTVARTWMGALLHRMHFVWPNFCVQDLTWSGVPPSETPWLPISRRFQNNLRVKKWRARQCGLLSSRPTKHQQDFLLFLFLLSRQRLCPRKKSRRTFPSPKMRC